jgi:hypothetical protein
MVEKIIWKGEQAKGRKGKDQRKRERNEVLGVNFDLKGPSHQIRSA